MALFAGTTLYWDMSVRLELLMTGYWCSVDDTENDSSLAGLKQQQPLRSIYVLGYGLVGYMR